MGKFIKKVIDELIAKKEKFALDSKTVSKGMLDVSYYFIINSIKAFIKGNPNLKERKLFEFGLIPAIDGNDEIKLKCKSIVHEWKKNHAVSIDDREWLDKHLLPWVEKSLLKQTDKTFAAIDAVNENKINEFVAKMKEEKKLRGVGYK